MFFLEDLILQAENFDANGKMMPNTILALFENAANHHSAFVNDNISSDGTSWIITEWRVKINKTPTIDDKLQIKTWTTGAISHFKADRELLMLDCFENVLISAEAKLALLDVKSGKPVMIGKEKMAKYEPENIKVFENDLHPLKSCSEYDNKSPLHLRRSDIDFNGHVHNTKYMDFAMEAVDEQTYKNNNYSSFRIAYKSALKLKDEAYITSTKTNEGYILCIYSENKLSAVVEMNVREN